MIRPDLVVKYPPELDGELHVQCDETGPLGGPAVGPRIDRTYSFTIAARHGEDPWDTLNRAATDIQAHVARRRS